MGSLVLAGATSGSTTITPTDAVTVTCTLPSTGGTLQTSGSGFTTNGVAYASSTSALTTGSGLVFDGTNLGVGVTPSAWSNYKAIQMGSGVGLASYTAGAIILNLGTNQYYNGTNYVYVNTDFAASYQQTSGIHKWWTAPSGTAGNAITLTQAMTLNASGDLGVGTTTPDIFGNGFARSLGVYSTGVGATSSINVSGSAASRIQFGVGSTRYGLIYQDASNFMQIATTTALPISFVTNNAEGMRLDSSGNLLVGTTSTPSNSCRLAAFGSGTYTFAINSGTYTWYSGTSSNNMNFYSGEGTIRGYLTLGGTFTNTSDVSLKENIVDLTYGLPEVLQLKPRKYNVKGYEPKQIGFIAQEVQSILPELVDENNGLLGLSYGNMTAVLANAIQEMHTLITAQQSTIQSLTERITALEGART